MSVLRASLAAAAALSVAACSEGVRQGGCVPVEITAEPVAVVSRGGADAPVSLTARVTEGGEPRAGIRVTWHLLAEDSTSGEFLGDDETGADGVARLNRAYIASADRERYRRAVKVVAAHDGLIVVDGVDYCAARAEAAFTFTEA